MKEKTKKNLSKFLITLSIVLAFIWVALLGYGLLFEQKKDIELAKANKQIVEITIDKTSTQTPITTSVNRSIASPLPKSKVALLITNLGTNKYITEQVLNLPTEVVLGFLPSYLEEDDPQLANAKKLGFNIMYYLPADNMNNLLANENNLKEFSENRGAYTILNENTKVQDLLLAAKSLENKKAQLLIKKSSLTNNYSNLPSNIIISDVVIDEANDADSIKENFAKLAATSKQNDYAIGYINNYPLSLEILKDWLTQLEDMGIEIVSLHGIKDATE